MKRKEINVQTGEEILSEITQEEYDAQKGVEDPKILLLNLRSRRNALIAETDYLALADATLTDEMRAYRQALRDLPANTDDPANPVWPVKPVLEEPTNDT